ncbi:9208_t:CDS:2 [Dentiscutata erythropus]|uniref:9208_t:CDS:1 n=1 Tax=Dentiscutata erythropus TaxID=1348616 RepID=A0A9N8YXW7_9GLOM|nr:9208_t:CDS:2 [Dentiscutata erythropus]
MTKTIKIKKRQNTQSTCQRVFAGGTGQLGKLLCCDNANSTNCLASLPTCTNVNKLIQCWSIKGLDACISRNDTTAQEVCSHQNDDGIFCLEGNTDLPYNNTDTFASAINYMLGRYTAKDLQNGASCYGFSCPQVACSYGCRQMHCGDSLASGSCQVTNDLGGTNTLNYQIEICAPQAPIVAVSAYIPPPKTISNLPNGSPGSNLSNGSPGTAPSTFMINSNSYSGLSGGATAGIVITLIIIVSVIIGIVYWRQTRNNSSPNLSPPPYTDNDDPDNNLPPLKKNIKT